MTRRPITIVTTRRRALGSLLALGAAAAGCGGGGGELAGIGSGGTGQVAGSFSTGPISGFGSVIVNGVKYDDSAASVADDAGRTRRLGELGLGMIVEIEGTVDAAAGTGTARAIRIVGQLAGTVASLDAAAGRFVVLGVVVQTDASTVWSSAAGLAGLGVGGPVEAWGFADPSTGMLRASRVDTRGDVEGLARLRGPASGYDRAAARLTIGTQVVDLRAAGELPARIDDGTEVRVAGLAVAAGQVLRAVRLDLVRPQVADGVADARVDGTVSRFESISRFAVAGLRVDASGATVSGGSAASLRNGARVRVIGSVTGGTLVARSLEIRVVPGASGDASGGDGTSGGANGHTNGDAGNGANPPAAGGEDPAQIRGTVVAAGSLSAVVVRDAYGREFILDAGAGRIVGGTAADLVPGTAIVVTGVRATVVRAATIRIER